MIKPKVGVCTAITKEFNLGAEDSKKYQKDLVDAVESSGFEAIQAENFISTPAIAEETANNFIKKDVDLFILNIGTFVDDLRIMPLVINCKKPFIIWCNDINAFNISITGAQNIIPNLYDLKLDYRFIYGDFDDEIALKKLQSFTRASFIKNMLRKTKIGYFGGHPSIMTSLTIDEIAIKKFFGISLYNFGNEDIFLESKKISKAESKKMWEKIKSAAGKIDASEDLGLINSSILVYLLKIVKEKGLNSVSVNCFPHLKGKVCIPIARLNDMGISAGCEGDLDSTIIMHVLYNLSGKTVANGDQLKIFNLDKPDNFMMFTHCGAGGFTLAANQEEVSIHTDFETGKGIAVYFPERIPGEVTVVNMHGSREGYRMFFTKGKVLDINLMKYYEGNPMGIQFNFNIRDMLEKIAYGGFGHHWSIGYGNYIEELTELCRLLKINYTTI
ncbi:MAG: hypothetical protein M1308_11635 [Actinobacteria bacterium]|nr:hypothetical protein [Actinomycetota bacterium]